MKYEELSLYCLYLNPRTDFETNDPIQPRYLVPHICKDQKNWYWSILNSLEELKRECSWRPGFKLRNNLCYWERGGGATFDKIFQTGIFSTLVHVHHILSVLCNLFIQSKLLPDVDPGQTHHLLALSDTRARHCDPWPLLQLIHSVVTPLVSLNTSMDTSSILCWPSLLKITWTWSLVISVIRNGK